MKVYNTLTRQLEEFHPLTDKKVLFYQCGPTVYWVQHIGNLRAITWADIIRQSLIYLGFDVRFVRNYTDVGHLTSDADAGEDKMEKGAKREHLTPQQIADKYIKIFENDTAALNILPPDFTPRATEYIPQMIDMIKILLDKGYAYITSSAVVYDTSKFKNYNQLNRQNIDEMKKGMGKGQIEDPEKKHFADFNLWVFKKGIHKNALQTWPSPWGEGFPGWHIECSAMSQALLGTTIDIHMGGVEHIPVHHTNEIAQSEAANGVKFVDYWLHNEHLSVNEQKMAKSTGTGFTLQEIINKGFDPLSLRYFYLNAHYRSKQNFTFDALQAAQTAFRNLQDSVRTLRRQTKRLALSEEKLKAIDRYHQQFINFISNDFQIPQALAMAWEMLKSNIPSEDKLDLLLEFDHVFGLKLNEVTPLSVPPEITALTNRREMARKEKNFAESDRLRKEIEDKGYIVDDTPAGPKIKVK